MSCSVANPSMRIAISALTGGRPVRCGCVHFRVIRPRCHHRTVPGGPAGVPTRITGLVQAVLTLHLETSNKG